MANKESPGARDIAIGAGGLKKLLRKAPSPWPTRAFGTDIRKLLMIARASYYA
jgi:hypothetical protein